MKITNIRCVLLLVIMTACVPRERVVLQEIRNLSIEAGQNFEPVLAGEAVFYNPNNARMKLREIDIEVQIDGKKSATIKQRLAAVAKPKSEFAVPLKVQLALKDVGLGDALKSLFGAKKYKIRYAGFLRVTINGLPMKIRVDHQEEFKLRL
jgi:LEA14-like dessication related protein